MNDECNVRKAKQPQWRSKIQEAVRGLYRPEHQRCPADLPASTSQLTGAQQLRGKGLPEAKVMNNSISNPRHI
ncbi:hypothetical protein GE061_009605 [Apolygus lucorum]|uniref:Uncharacterized protein n=1 Tax=Apolygus lucorum TaxID=248454 RepID=A0A8S9Y2R8_APOLU|nr:hypothetical protein GE061_009605 [Apolygus lucorum]